jgi:hypothetical protein
MRSLLRGGQTAQAVARLEEVQRLAPNLPHTCFNLGIYYKKAGEVQSESMPEVSSADLSRVGATFDEELPMGPASFL